MKLDIAYIAISCLVLSGCSSDEQPLADSGSTSPIEISTYIGQSRAANKTSFAEGDVIGLYACKTNGNYSSNFIADFMNNVAVTRTASEWTYSPLMAWPTDETQHLSFIAYYPQSTAQTNARNYPFTASTLPTAQTDPLWCVIRDASRTDRNGTSINGSETDAGFDASNGPLYLKFKHMLANVRISIKLDNPYPGVTAKLKSMILYKVSTTGNFIVSADLMSAEWNNVGTSKNIVIKNTVSDDLILNDEPYSFPDLMMVPQSTILSETYLEFTYTHTYTVGEGEKSITKKIYLSNNWEINKIYNYIINLSLDSSTITLNTEINDWNAPAESDMDVK